MRNKKTLSRLILASFLLLLSNHLFSQEFSDTLFENENLEFLDLPEDSIFINATNEGILCFVYSWGNGTSTLSKYTLSDSSIVYEFFVKNRSSNSYEVKRFETFDDVKLEPIPVEGYFQTFLTNNFVSPCSKDIILLSKGEVMSRFRLERAPCNNQDLPKARELYFINEIIAVSSDRE